MYYKKVLLMNLMCMSYLLSCNNTTI